MVTNQQQTLFFSTQFTDSCEIRNDPIIAHWKSTARRRSCRKNWLWNFQEAQRHCRTYHYRKKCSTVNELLDTHCCRHSENIIVLVCIYLSVLSWSPDFFLDCFNHALSYPQLTHCPCTRSLQFRLSSSRHNFLISDISSANLNLFYTLRQALVISWPRAWNKLKVVIVMRCRQTVSLIDRVNEEPTTCNRVMTTCRNMTISGSLDSAAIKLRRLIEADVAPLLVSLQM